MASESDVQLYSGQPSGPLLRTLNITTMINGVATTVQMEVAAITDQDGYVISVSDLRDIAWKRAMLRELRAIRIAWSHQLGENLYDLAKSEDEV